MPIFRRGALSNGGRLYASQSCVRETKRRNSTPIDSNGRDDRVLINQDHTDEIKKDL